MREFLTEKSLNLKQGGIRAMFDRISGRENIISLTVGEPDFYTHPDIINAACKAFIEGFTHYSPNAGYPDLRKAICKAPVTCDLEYNPDNEIIVTVGAMEALAMIFFIILSPGDEVIMQDPAWVNYYSLISYPGGVPVPVPTKIDDGFKFRPEEIEKCITKKTKAILINNPSNPTGACLTRQDLEKVAQVAIKHDLLVISDEVYNMLIYDGQQANTIAEFPGMRERTIVINSFSKAFAMTGWRIGYAMGPSRIISKMILLQENMVSCVTSAVQEAARYALTRYDLVRNMAAVYEEKRNIIYEGLSKIKGFQCVKPGGAFYIFPNISGLCEDSAQFCYELLDEEGVACVPGETFGKAGQGHIRISYANSIDNINKALEKIHHFVEKRY